MILALSLACALFVPASAKEGIAHGDTVLSINGVVSAALKPGYASLDTTFSNSTSEDVSVTMVMTEFTENNGYKKTVSRSSENKIIPAGKTVHVSPGIEISAPDAKINYFAYETSTLIPVAVENYTTENFRYIAQNDDETIYKIYSFDDIKNTEIDNSKPEALSAPSVCAWQGDRASAVSITMDDGIYSAAAEYNKLFKKYNIHGTEMMITGYIAKDDGTPREKSATDGSTIKQWQDIFDDGYIDLGNHSYHHDKTVWQGENYTAEKLRHSTEFSRQVLENIFPGQDVITFATPWGANFDDALNIIKEKHYLNRAAGGDIVQGKTPDDFYRVPTITVVYGTPLLTLNGAVDRAITAGGWVTELYHGIGGSSSEGGSYVTNINTMEEHLKYINSKSDKIWAGSLTEVTKYIYERNTAKVKQLWATNSSVGIKLSDGMDDDVFDYPLTVKVNLPAAWSGSVKCTQLGKTENAEIFKENGKSYVYVNIVPDKGNVIISK